MVLSELCFFRIIFYGKLFVLGVRVGEIVESFEFEDEKELRGRVKIG